MVEVDVNVQTKGIAELLFGLLGWGEATLATFSMTPAL